MFFRDIDVSYTYSLHLINVLSECGFIEFDMIDKRSKRAMIQIVVKDFSDLGFVNKGIQFQGSQKKSMLTGKVSGNL